MVKEAKVVWEQKLEKSLTAMQGFVTENSKMEGDLDSWSESDKAAFRARMGLREDCGVGSSSKHRTTEEEGRDGGHGAAEGERQGGQAAAGGKD